MSVAHWVTLFQAWGVSASGTNWQLYLLMQNLAMESTNSNNNMLANDPGAGRLVIAGKQEEGNGRCSTGRRSKLCWDGAS